MKTIQKKVCMLGSFAVGKTSMVKRFVEGRFDDRYLSTIGVKISRRKVAVAEDSLSLIVWDLAGGDEFLRTNTSYLRGAAGCLIVCDLTRPQTVRSIDQYAEQMLSANPAAKIIIVGNKADLVDEIQVSKEDLQAVSQSLSSCPVYLTSAKSGINVSDAFKSLAENIINGSLEN